VITEGSGSVFRTIDAVPDPGGLKQYGSGSATLVQTNLRSMFVSEPRSLLDWKLFGCPSLQAETRAWWISATLTTPLHHTERNFHTGQYRNRYSDNVTKVPVPYRLTVTYCSFRRYRFVLNPLALGYSFVHNSRFKSETSKPNSTRIRIQPLFWMHFWPILLVDFRFLRVQYIDFMSYWRHSKTKKNSI
jgi:hypothetical protein